MKTKNYLLPETRTARFVRNSHDILKESGINPCLADVCAAVKVYGIDLTERDAGQYLLRASNAPDFQNFEHHCANCNCDFELTPEQENEAGEMVRCPNCLALLNTAASKKENIETQKQQDGSIESGRRGSSGTSSKADIASVHASMASDCAEKSGASSDHDAAAAAHAEAATLHRGAQKYHTKQFLYHSEKSDAAADADANAGGLELDCARSAGRSFIGGNDDLPDIVPYMPAGVHTISPSCGGQPVTVTVFVCPDSAVALEKQRQALEATGNRPFFSIQHNTQVAAFWPTRFFWDTRPDANGNPASGVWAEGTWSKSGRDAVEGKDFRTFSPTFFVDAIRNDSDNPARIVANFNAKLNMGALENDPAFQSIPALWS
jgi:hypothetical protein